MTPGKTSWADKLKRWMRRGDEEFAKAVLSPPAKTTLARAIPFPGVVIILGSRGSGKSGLAHEIMDQMHRRRKLGGAVLLPQKPQHKSRLLPSWVKVVTSIKDLPKRSVCIIDEAAQIAHARRSQSTEAVDLDNLVSISRHRQQLIILITHHSRKLDVLMIHDSDRLLWKEPTDIHALFERDEIQLFTRKALDFFTSLRTARAKQRATYVVDVHHLAFSWFNNNLPNWWSERLSAGFEDMR